jgi:putative hydrolase of the HAD superfamily
VIRAVIFDFGNVLCFPPSLEKVRRAADFCNLSVDSFWDAFWDERLDYDAGKLEPLRYWTGVTNEAFARANLDTLIRHEVEFWNRYDPRPFHWIAALRAAGIKVGMLSNLPRVLGEALKKERYLGRPFLDHFDHVTLSYELLSVKPQAAIYHHAFEGLGIAPSDALFLDDKLPNVHGAIETGLQAEHFLSWEDFVERDVPGIYGLPEATYK